MAKVAERSVEGFLRGVVVDGSDDGVPAGVAQEVAAGKENGLLEAAREGGGLAAVDAERGGEGRAGGGRGDVARGGDGSAAEGG